MHVVSCFWQHTFTRLDKWFDVGTFLYSAAFATFYCDLQSHDCNISSDVCGRKKQPKLDMVKPYGT